MLVVGILNLILALLNGAALLCLLLAERRKSGAAPVERSGEESFSARSRRMDQGFENLMSYTAGREYRLDREGEWV